MLGSGIHYKWHPHLQEKDNVGHVDMLTQKEGGDIRGKQKNTILRKCIPSNVSKSSTPSPLVTLIYK